MLVCIEIANFVYLVIVILIFWANNYLSMGSTFTHSTAFSRSVSQKYEFSMNYFDQFTKVGTQLIDFTTSNNLTNFETLKIITFQ
jgi:hypothetical protein